MSQAFIGLFEGATPARCWSSWTDPQNWRLRPQTLHDGPIRPKVGPFSLAHPAVSARSLPHEFPPSPRRCRRHFTNGQGQVLLGKRKAAMPLLVHRRRPSGAGETFESAAIREVEEETAVIRQPASSPSPTTWETWRERVALRLCHPAGRGVRGAATAGAGEVRGLDLVRSRPCQSLHL